MTWKGENMKRITLLLWGTLIFLGSMAQSVKGIIHDANGDALSSVNIVLPNQNRQTISNSSGYFELLNLRVGKEQLQISFIGKQIIIKQIVLIKSQVIDLGIIEMQDAQFNTDEIVVTATKTPRLLSALPVSMVYVSSKELQVLPSQKVDDNLKYSSGIIVDRPFGIFGKSVVGIRGLVSSEPGRQLTLIDGIPINKSDGGGVNWNRIINSDIEHIEVVKGPGSSIYGSNAMGGIINLISKRPYSKGLRANAKAFYGSYNTHGAEFSLMQKNNNKSKGFYYAIAGKLLKSNGYITVPDSIRNKSDTLVFVEEQAINTRLGYNFSSSSFLELEYNYYNDHRGQGTKIQLEDGATADYDTHFFKSKYNTNLKGFQIDVNTFYQLENYLRTIEKVKKGNYTLIHVNSDRQDYGLLSSVYKSFSHHKLSFGADYRNGSVYGVDEYQTSTDKVINKGKMQQANLYFQDELSFTEKFRTIAAIQFSHIRFSDGAFLLENATGATDFMNDFTGKPDIKNWNGWNPSLSLQYDFTKNLNLYAIASRGFRAASLDDLTRTGFINIGYKRANPNLEPEVIKNIEIGIRFQKKKYRINAQAYYSKGDNFMYYVATGETIFGGRKKVYEKRNISNVEIMGLEAEAKYRLNELLSISANYTFNQSIIKKFKERSDLQGNTLTYSPNHIFNFSALLSNNNWSSSVNIHWQSKLFLNEDNTFSVNDLMGVDLRVAYQFYKGIGVGVNMNNVLDEQHLVSNDQVSLGRFITIELLYKL